MGRRRASNPASSHEEPRAGDRGEGRVLLVAMTASLAVHLTLFLINPRIPFPGPPAAASPMRVHDAALPEEQPPAVEVPAPAVPIPPPSRPVVERVDDVPAEPDGPRYIAHDVPPSLLNGVFVSRYLEMFYPPGLRMAGIEGRVLLWLYVERDGQVTKLRLQRSSGAQGLDDLARSAARIMRFRPALSRDRTVAVWVAQPLEFRLVGTDSALALGRRPGNP